MSATRARGAGANGNHRVAAKARDAGDAVTSAAWRVPVPALAAGATAAGLAGLAGGVLIGSRAARPGKRWRAVLAVAREASDAASDVRLLREHLESLNRRSPVEVLLDGLTHRRGAHRRET